MRRSVLLLSLALAACGPVEPRFGSVSVSATAPRATLTGHTSESGAPAVDLSAGCPGFIGLDVPEHLVRLDDASAITISARSLRGPLAIAVVGPHEVRCDSDEGTGHSPHVTITQPGEYFVHVGALTTPADLPYDLSLAPAAATGTTGGVDHRVSVTVTSDPSGATVRTPEGETLGTTPAMFVLTVPDGEMGSERRFVLEMPGHPSTNVSGRVIGETMVLHASLTQAPVVATPSAAPVITSGVLDAASSGAAVPIRDYRAASLALEVPSACTIASMSIDVDAQHAYSQDLRITLTGPTGASAMLANHGGGGRPYSPHTYAWDDVRGALHAFAGTSTQGTWRLEVRDDAGEDEGALRGFTLHVRCGDASAPVPPIVTAPPTTRVRPRPPHPTVVVRPPPPYVPPPYVPPRPPPLRNGGGPAGGVITAPF
jgi:subtilisin-like proprotein convertase family protein